MAGDDDLLRANSDASRDGAHEQREPEGAFWLIEVLSYAAELVFWCIASVVRLIACAIAAITASGT